MQTTHKTHKSEKLTHHKVFNGNAILKMKRREITYMFRHVHFSRNTCTIGEIRLIFIRWTGHAVRMGDLRNLCNVFIGKLERLRSQQELSLRMRRIKMQTQHIATLCMVVQSRYRQAWLSGSGELFSILQRIFWLHTQCHRFMDQQQDYKQQENYTLWNY
jgi:hypothetical protein